MRDPREVRSGRAADADARRRQQGQQLVARLVSVMRTGRAYQTANQVFRQQLGLFIEALQPVLDEEGEAVLVVVDHDLYLNGVRLPIKGAVFKFHEAVSHELERRKIAGIRWTEGVTPEELERFFDLYLQPHLYRGPDLLEACQEACLERVLPAVHASTEQLADDAFVAPDEADGDGSAPGDGAGDGAAGHGAGDLGSLPQYGGPRGAAKKQWYTAVAGARSLLVSTMHQEGTPLRHAKRVVQPLVDGALADEPLVVGLSSLGHHDAYTYSHGVNVCMIAVTIGKQMRVDRRTLTDLGVAALLHDVGKSVVAPMVCHPFEEFTPEDRAAAERHSAEGARLIARSTVLNETTMRCMRVALEHHLTSDGKGYPRGESVARASLMSRLVSVADCYVSLMTYRGPRGRRVTPYEALGYMLGPLNRRFYPALLWALVQALGYYPPGQLVELDTGELAQVLAPNPADLARPHLVVIRTADGTLLPEADAPEYRPLPPERRVARSLRSDEYPRSEGEGGAQAA